MSAISSSTVSFNPQVTQGATQGARRGHHHRHGGGAEFNAAFSAAAKDVGVDPSKVGELQKQIDAAIQDARKNAGSTDPRKAVQNAIDTVLQNNGVDPAKFDQALKSEFDKLRAQRNQSGGVDRPHDGDSDDARPASSSAPITSINTTA